MAEGQRERFAHLVREIAEAYVDINQAYLELPLPIRLPSWGGMPGISNVRAAILSAAERVGDLPVEEGVALALSQASLHWASATVLTVVYRETGDDTIFDVAHWNTAGAGVLGAIALDRLRQG